jgi:uncharacterized protein
MINTKLPRYILASAVLISLLAAGCSSDKQPNDLQRPAESKNENSNTVTQSENGEVAGSEIVELPKKKISVASQEIEVEVADNNVSREQGLSNRESLTEGQGMLFDFTNTDFRKPGFWMKDMKISIDIIWISNDKIIGIDTSVPLPPEDADLPVYYPPSDITHALEVPAEWTTKNNVLVGDTIKM